MRSNFTSRSTERINRVRINRVILGIQESKALRVYLPIRVELVENPSSLKVSGYNVKALLQSYPLLGGYPLRGAYVHPARH